MQAVTLDVEAMEAGLELDVLIAERVMGLRAVHFQNVDPFWESMLPPSGWAALPADDPELQAFIEDNGAGGVIQEVWLQPYSTDIAAAWQVVEAMLDKGYWFNSGHKGKPPFWPSIDNSRPWWVLFHGDDERVDWAETAPLAICRAALKAHYEG